MKRAEYICAVSFVLLFLCSVAAAQDCVGINFFDAANSYSQPYTCWDGSKCHVYKSGTEVFTTCGDGGIPVNMSVGTGSLVLTSSVPSGWWNIEFKIDWGHSVNFLRYGNDPLLHLRVKWGQIASGADMWIELRDDQQILSSYWYYTGQGSVYSNQNAWVLLSNYVTPSTSQWQDVYIPISDFLADNPYLDLTRIGILKLHGAGSYSGTNTLYIEKMRVVPDTDCEYPDMVKVNQLGYLPNDRKLAIVSYQIGEVASAPTFFQVREEATDDIVYQGSLSYDAPVGSSWDYSGDRVYHADFSAFTTPGRYVIYCPELGQTSVPFDISARAFNGPFRDALRFFYYARSGNDIVEPYAEGYIRPTIYANNVSCPYDYDSDDPTKMYDYDPLNMRIVTRDVKGGWFDAGDLHLDVHNNVATLWFLLETFEQFNDKLGPDILNLPESDGQINDLVLLIRYQLDWFKKMQNTDGSVHFIVYNYSSDSQQTISDVSSGAACVLAGIFAKAYTVFSSVPGMESYSADLLSRAETSWSWLLAHPDNYNPTGAGGSTWSYGIRDDTSFRSFAAIELYIATGNTAYRTFFETAFNSTGDAVTAFPGDFGGSGASGCSGHYSYIAFITGINGITAGYMDYVDTTRPVTASIKNNIKNHFLSDAANALTHRNYTTYNIPLYLFNDLSWGSSGMLCGNAYILLRAYGWTGDSNYRDAAMDVLDWISGRNPVSRVFVTGYGDYLHGTDHYSFYMFDHLNPVPGYLCGNINAFGADWGQHPLNYYIKYKYKYYLNIQTAGLLEPCLPWQAAACYLLGYFASDLKMTGDFYPDGTVDMLDLMVFSRAWLSGPSDDNW
ncbi:MAG: glycoside hydrolase family 9 protein, partial [Sedimentisphaerales bacterium]|nr:glycoside hydrolase family 9 protein [Sedimentisphaerales bacterium]